MEIFGLLACSPDSCNSQYWAKPSSGARNFTRVPDRGSRGPDTWATLLCFYRAISRELNQKRGSQHKAALVRSARFSGSGLTCYGPSYRLFTDAQYQVDKFFCSKFSMSSYNERVLLLCIQEDDHLAFLLYCFTKVNCMVSI